MYNPRANADRDLLLSTKGRTSSTSQLPSEASAPRPGSAYVLASWQRASQAECTGSENSAWSILPRFHVGTAASPLADPNHQHCCTRLT